MRKENAQGGELCSDAALWSMQLQLCVSTSSWSDGFSLDTVGSYGCVRCPANNMDFLVTKDLSQRLKYLFWVVKLGLWTVY